MLLRLLTTTQMGAAQVTTSQQTRGGDGSVTEVLEQTLWNRSLGIMSEEIVAALVCQIFEGEPLNAQPCYWMTAAANACKDRLLLLHWTMVFSVHAVSLSVEAAAGQHAQVC